MSLAWFPCMGSSASVAVTWATVVPAGGWVMDHKGKVSSGSGEIKWLRHSPAGSVWLQTRRRGDENTAGCSSGLSRLCQSVCDSLFSPPQHLIHRPPPSHTQIQFRLFLFHTYRGKKILLLLLLPLSTLSFSPSLIPPRSTPPFLISLSSLLPSPPQLSFFSPFSKSKALWFIRAPISWRKKADYI